MSWLRFEEGGRVRFSQPVSKLIAERFSCRIYRPTPIASNDLEALRAAAVDIHEGPLGTPLRFSLIAATKEGTEELRGLGTYGFIKEPAGFIVGAAATQGKYLEDYGYTMELLILAAADLGLGTCWLGGFFTRSSFFRTITVGDGESMPAVASVGVMPDIETVRKGTLRRLAGGDRRLPWENLFFDGKFDAPLAREAAGPLAEALEMVRLGPSASNKQPWRIVKDGASWHFYVHRTRGYRLGLAGKLLKLEDMQRLDMGIAMCHFELMARELGQDGRWAVRAPDIATPDSLTEYAVSWVEGE
jgi:nitroreductase